MKKDLGYLGYFREHKWKIFLIAIFTTIATVGSFVTTLVLSQIVDKLKSSTLTDISSYAIKLLVIELFLVAFANFLADKFLLRVKSDVIRKLHLKLAQALAKASSESVSNLETASVVKRLREGNTFVDTVHNIYMQCFGILQGVAALVYTAIYSWQIFLLFSVFFIIIFFIQVFRVNLIRKKREAAANASDSSEQLLYEIVQAFQDVKAQGLTSGLKPHFLSTSSNEVQLQEEAELLDTTGRLFSRLILAIYNFSFIALGIWLVQHGNLAFQPFVALFMYKGRVESLVGCILEISRQIPKYQTCTKRMDEILKYQGVTKEIFGKQKLANPSGSISIKDLYVTIENTNIINGLSVEIPAGKFIGVVGDSGCGKSTLFKVLSRQLTPSSGEIILDGYSLYDLDEWSFHRCINIASQQPFLFSLSIRENLLLANPEASDGAMWECLKECSADKFVHEKGGLDTLIDPRKLSGGQKQRLALARIPLHGGKIILLDESTSALDGESQEVVINSIQNAAKCGHTMLLIAHRISSLKNADLILVMDDGKVVASGSYSELYQNCEKFRRLANLG